MTNDRSSNGSDRAARSGNSLSFTDVLDTHAAIYPDRAALQLQSGPRENFTPVTYRQLADASRNFARRLLSSAQPGQRALISGTDELAFVTALLGCMYAGVTAVPLAPLRSIRHLVTPAAIAADAGASLLISCTPEPQPELLGRFLHDTPGVGLLDACTQSAPSPDSPFPQADNPLAYLQYSSGSTGAPKGVMVSQKNLLGNLTRIIRHFDLHATDIATSWLPLFHDLGLTGGLLVPLMLGSTCRLMPPSQFLSNPLRWLQAISDSRSSLAAAPNFAYDLCVEKISPTDIATLDLSCWRHAWVGAEPVRHDTLVRFAQTFAPAGFRHASFKPGYGQAEAVLFVAGATGAQASTTTAPTDLAGRALPGHGAPGDHVIIVNPETRHRIDSGGNSDEGEIWVGAQYAASGYWQRPELTEQTFRARLEPTCHGRYLRTGDTGVLRAGELYITGRLSDLIIVRGRNLHPQDIEQSVESITADIIRGGVAAFEWAGPDGNGIGLICEVRRHSASTRSPADLARKIVQSVSSDYRLSIGVLAFVIPARIPRTSSGKIRRRDAAHALQAQTLDLWYRTDFSTAAPPERTPGAPESAQYAGLARILDILRAKLRSTEATITADTAINALGLDSLDAVNLKFRLEQETGASVPVECFFDGSTIGHLANILTQPTATTTEVSQAPAKTHTSARIAESAKAPGAAVSKRQTTGDKPLPSPAQNEPQGLQFSLMYFASDADLCDAPRYQLMLDSARYADTHGFHAVWLPERHFHAFGANYPSPVVLAAALAPITSTLRLRAGSVVLPLHHPLTVAEQWSVVDNLSGGRVDLAVAAGWNPDDYILAPDNFAQRHDIMAQGIQTLRSLWRGESFTGSNGTGGSCSVKLLPQPVQADLPLWLTCSGSVERFEQAGAIGANVLTALLFQDLDELRQKIAAYRNARERHGHDPQSGRVTLMLHTCIGESDQQVREMVRAPFTAYLESSVDLWRRGATRLDALPTDQRQQVLNFAFERYYRESALFGSVATCRQRLLELQAVGVNEIASLIDFGLPGRQTLDSLTHLNRLKTLVQHDQTTSLASASRNTPHRTRLPDTILTGATGLLGSHLLVELLKTAERDVLCLVRADDDALARDRLQKVLKERGLWQSSFGSRIHAVAADLCEPRLGLDRHRYQQLCASTRTVIHAAADMRLLASYAALAPCNVHGTLAMLQLAQAADDCEFHHISSTAVFRSGYRQTEVLSESNRPRGGADWPAALARTKFEAEQQVWQAADNGLAVKVFRPGPVASACHQRADAPAGYPGRFIALCAALGSVPATNESLSVCGVDAIARAIIGLGDDPSLSGQAFHLVDADPLTMTNLAEHLTKAGYCVAVTPALQWHQQLAALASRNGDPAAELARLLLLLQPPRPGRRSSRIFSAGMPGVSSRRTRQHLRRLCLDYTTDRHALIAQSVSSAGI